MMYIYKLKTLNVPDFLMLLINRIELNCSLLQFKHKASFMAMDNVIYPPVTSEILPSVIKEIIDIKIYTHATT